MFFIYFYKGKIKLFQTFLLSRSGRKIIKVILLKMVCCQSVIISFVSIFLKSYGHVESFNFNKVVLGLIP